MAKTEKTDISDLLKFQEELEAVVRKVVKEELDNYEHKCRFDIDDNDAKQFGHFIGMVEDMGDGKIGSGIEIMRDNHQWLSKQRQRGDKLSGVIMLVIVSSVVGGLLVAVWEGIKGMVGR